MDEIATRSAHTLHETDFYAWTQSQATLLRDGRLDEADLINLLEEIESLGRTQVAELRSRLKVLAHHLLKEIHRPERASRSWATTIIVQRDEIATHLRDNPSLRTQTADLFRQAYRSARKTAAAEAGLPSTIFPSEPPFTCGQLTDEAYWPGRPIEDRS